MRPPRLPGERARAARVVWMDARVRGRGGVKLGALGGQLSRRRLTPEREANEAGAVPGLAPGQASSVAARACKMPQVDRVGGECSGRRGEARPRLRQRGTSRARWPEGDAAARGHGWMGDGPVDGWVDGGWWLTMGGWPRDLGWGGGKMDGWMDGWIER